MVWIQGGEFEFGGQAGYDGGHFARDGIVCVVINWRVGADGFLYLGDGNKGANLGARTQLILMRPGGGQPGGVPGGGRRSSRCGAPPG
jgi:para-nitrobenzyl esterase